jgi:hypothetical protein
MSKIRYFNLNSKIKEKRVWFFKNQRVFLIVGIGLLDFQRY